MGFIQPMAYTVYAMYMTLASLFFVQEVEQSFLYHHFVVSNFLVLVSIGGRLTLEFSSMCSQVDLKKLKCFANSWTFYKYFTSFAYLVWYSPTNWLMTSWESLLALRLDIPTYLAKFIYTIKVLYSAWLLLALNLNLSDNLIRIYRSSPLLQLRPHFTSN